MTVMPLTVNIKNPITGEKIKVFERVETPYCVLEVSPSQLTSNRDVKWLISEFARLYKPLEKRINLASGRLQYQPELSVWWEVFLHKGQIKFYMVIPDKDNIKMSLVRQIMRTWKQASVKEVKEYIPQFNPDYTDITKLSLKHHSVLSLDTEDANYSPLDAFLNAKHHIKDEDMAMLQIGMVPVGSGWNDMAIDIIDRAKKSSKIPRKKGKKLTFKDALQGVMSTVGLIAEEFMNLLGDFLVPGWENNTEFADSLKERNGSVDSNSTKKKVRDDGFKATINLVAMSEDAERRKTILRAMASAFDPLEGDNKLVETPVVKNKEKEIKKVVERKMEVRVNGDVFGSTELSKMIQVPDKNAQREHYNELDLATHRSETEVPKEIFEDDGGIPFAKYEDTDGVKKTVYFNAKNLNHLCMSRVIIGKPGSGKTTFAANNALDSFNKGYGAFVVDAADGQLIQSILDHITPEQRDKVKILDLINTDMPIGLGLNEIFQGRNTDIIEDLVVEELLAFMELVSGTELNMRAKQWVENAIKVVFVTPDATIQDVENMLNNAEYRGKIIEGIKDPHLKADWEMYHNQYAKELRATIYDEAFRRLSALTRKKTLRNFILQRPKKDAEGNYLIDFRKWMDEGYLVLVKANETLGTTLQTALVSFLLAKFNLAIVSREDIPDPDNRPPCFIYLDEPDHYIKGSERWRNMLTRYRKYRCGLNFMFHGWQQLKEADKDLPKLIRKAGPHYVIFHTDEDNLLELKPIIEPEFKIASVAKGMPEHHAIIKLSMYNSKGEPVPAFMAKAVDIPSRRFKGYSNDDLYAKCAQELGRPKEEVMNELFMATRGAEVAHVEHTAEGEGELVRTPVQLEMDEDEKRATVRKIEHMMSTYVDEQLAKGEEVDEELILEMDRIIEEV